MRMFFVWLTVLFLWFTITLSWYVCLPILPTLIMGVYPILAVGENAVAVAQMVEIMNYIWGPLMDFIILIWGIIMSQKRDPESEITYG